MVQYETATKEDAAVLASPFVDCRLPSSRPTYLCKCLVKAHSIQLESPCVGDHTSSRDGVQLRLRMGGSQILACYKQPRHGAISALACEWRQKYAKRFVGQNFD